MQKEANDAKSHRRSDEPGGTTQLAMCLARCKRRIARRLWKKQAADAIFSLEEGVILDACAHFLDEIGVLPQ